MAPPVSEEPPSEPTSLEEELGLLQARLTKNPNDAETLHRVGAIYSQQGNLVKAVDFYQAAVHVKPDQPQTHYSLGLVYSLQKMWPQAESAYREALRYNDKDHETWDNLGAVLEALGKTEDAMECFRKAIELAPTEQVARHRIGMLFFRKGDLTRAAEEFEKAVDINDQDHEAWNNLGLVAARRGETETAKEYYLKAIHLVPEFAKAWNNLGNAFSKLGEHRAAEEAYRKAIQFNGREPDFWFNLGEFLLGRGEPETEKCLLEAVSLNPGDLEAWELLRQWYVGAERPNHHKWKQSLTLLLQQNPDDKALLREMAMVQQRMGEAEDALKILRHLISLNPEDEETRLLMAALSLQQGRPLDAYSHLGKVESQSENVVKLWHQVGQRLLYHHKPDEAESCFLTVVAHHGERTEPWQYLGEIAMSRGQWDLAYERFSRAAPINRNNVAVWRPLADEFFRQRVFAKAASCLDNLPDHIRYLPHVWGEFYPIYAAAGKSGDFLTQLEKLLERELVPPRYWMDLAALYESAGKPDEARRCMDQLAMYGVPEKTNPAEGTRHLLENNDPAGAFAHLESIREHQKENPAFWRERAEVCMALDRLEEAGASLEALAALNAADYRDWFHLGAIQFKLGLPREAARAFKKSADLNPDEAKAWYNLGLTEDELGRPEEALRHFKTALKLHRGFPQAWNALGTALFRRKDFTGARRCFLRSLAKGRDRANTWHNLGVLYQKMGRTKDQHYCMQRAQALGGQTETPGISPVHLVIELDGAEAQPAAPSQPAKAPHGKSISHSQGSHSTPPAHKRTRP